MTILTYETTAIGDKSAAVGAHDTGAVTLGIKDRGAAWLDFTMRLTPGEANEIAKLLTAAADLLAERTEIAA